MKKKITRVLSLILICILLVQVLSGCKSKKQGTVLQQNGILITENKIEEQYIYEQKMDEEYFSEDYIAENVSFENGIYEYIIDSIVVGECRCFEITIGEHTEEEILEQLPEEIEDYEINWPAVIGKFAVGTTIIVATGVVGYYCPSTYYVVATPVEVGIDALIGGAIAAALEVGINELKTGGQLPEAGIKKYSIEGFADGFMWGAITSVLRVTSKNIARPHSLTTETGEVCKIALNGAVKDSAGKALGNAYYAKDGIYVLKEAGKKNVVELFDLSGKQVVNGTVEQLAALAENRLPSNATLCLGEEAAAQVCKTDADGVIYCINNELQKNITYKLGNAIYKTDSAGRIAEVVFDKLELKDPGRGRRVIANTINEIGKGFELAKDQRGHIIGDRFNGDNTLANMVPMSPEANQGQYKAIEDIWEEALKNGKNVSGTIKFSYTKNSFRPDQFKVVYDIGQGPVTNIVIN